MNVLAAILLSTYGCDTSYPPPGAYACEYTYAGSPHGPWIAFRVWSLPHGRIAYIATGGLS